MNKDDVKKSFRLKAAIILIGHPSNLESVIGELCDKKETSGVEVVFVKVSAAERLRIEESGSDDGEQSASAVHGKREGRA